MKRTLNGKAFCVHQSKAESSIELKSAYFMPDLNQQAIAKDFKSFVSTNFTNEAILNALGLEPKTYGLKVHHSTN
jgi:hypothetical protein